MAAEIDKMIAAITENNIPWINGESGSEPFTSVEFEELNSIALKNDLQGVLARLNSRKS